MWIFRIVVKSKFVKYWLFSREIAKNLKDQELLIYHLMQKYMINNLIRYQPILYHFFIWYEILDIFYNFCQKNYDVSRNYKLHNTESKTCLAKVVRMLKKRFRKILVKPAEKKICWKIRMIYKLMTRHNFKSSLRYEFERYVFFKVRNFNPYSRNFPKCTGVINGKLVLYGIRIQWFIPFIDQLNLQNPGVLA